MVRTLASDDWSMDFMVQVQTDPHRMPMEDATVKWPERLSPYVPVARLRLPGSVSTPTSSSGSPTSCGTTRGTACRAQAARGTRTGPVAGCTAELAALRQQMNQVEHVEPTGSESFPDNPALHRRPPRPPDAAESGGRGFGALTALFCREHFG